MKKILAVLLLAIVLIGCGPKMAKQETLDALAEARAALDAAQAKIAELEDTLADLQAQKAALTDEISGLEQDIADLEMKIDTRCNK
jgi:predicted  nucleic acid-binding Zn-ribbon protein